LPISADQLQNVLHSDALQNIAAKTGMDQGQLTSILSQMLPHVVDKLTPNGAVPEAGALTPNDEGIGGRAVIGSDQRTTSLVGNCRLRFERRY
jgi:hypothetical protein